VNGRASSICESFETNIARHSHNQNQEETSDHEAHEEQPNWTNEQFFICHSPESGNPDKRLTDREERADRIDKAERINLSK
jgi:hypothetical protein